jgi:hypothetical protein
VFGIVLAMLTAGAITLSSKLPKSAAALESIDPAIVTSHLQKLRASWRCPKRDSPLPTALVDSRNWTPATS